MARPTTTDALAEPPFAEDVESLAVALQDATRRRILLALLHDAQARTVDEVAALAGVHRTVAFTHLERLVALQLLEKRPRRGRRGKPASLYSVRTPVVALTYPPRQFQMLAGLLGSGLRSLGDAGCDVAREQGRRYGAGLPAERATTLEEALRPLRELGAEYTVVSSDIATSGCVFREACDEAREVVCSLHAGVLEGALGAAGIIATVEPRGALAPTGCHFGVQRQGR